MVGALNVDKVEFMRFMRGSSRLAGRLTNKRLAPG